MRVARILVAALMVSAWSAAEEDPGRIATTFDLPVRAVNAEVITKADIERSVVDRLRELDRQGRPLPLASERVQFCTTILEDLTDEALLRQFAVENQAKVDPARIDLMMLEDARANDVSLTLAQQTRRREAITRRELARAAIQFFDVRMPRPSPAELWAYYQSHRDEFRRPSRAHVYQILLQATPAEERDRLRRDQTDLVRRAQDPDLNDPVVNGVVQPLLQRYLAAEPAQRDAILGEIVQGLAGLGGNADLTARGAGLVRDAAAIRDRAAGTRSIDQAKAELEELRAKLDGAGVEAFRAAARRVSQGQRVAEGGDFGLREQGFFTEALDRQIFSQPADSLSPVVVVEQQAFLLYVAEREEAAVPGFAEISATIESQLAQRRQDEVKRHAVRILRSRAAIRDLIALTLIF